MPIRVVNLAEFEPKQLSLTIASNRPTVRLLYSGQTFYLATDVLEAPCGLDQIDGDSYGSLILRVDPCSKFADVLTQLDQIALNIGSRRSSHLFGQELDVQSVPYYPLLQDNSFKVLISQRTRLFNRTNQALSESYSQVLANQCQVNLVLNLSDLAVVNGTLRWQYKVDQLKLMQQSILPPGCLLMEHDYEVEQELARRRAQHERGARPTVNLPPGQLIVELGSDEEEEVLEEYGKTRK